MKKWLERLFHVKDERGLTLIELLAVIVILGIIGAIAVPSITGITENTKKEAHKANARQMIEAAKQMVAINGFHSDVAAEWKGYNTTAAGAINTTASVTVAENANKVMQITLKELIEGKYFSSIKNPENGSNYEDNIATKINSVYVYNDSGTYSYYVSLEDAKTEWESPLLESEIDKLKLN